MTRIAVVAGAVLGVVSRIEETTSGFSIGVSANATWLAVASLAGMMQPEAAALGGSAQRLRRPRGRRGASPVGRCAA